MEDGSLAALERVLAGLDRLILAEYPELHARFRPGLPEAEVERLAATLLPYHLPAELTVLSRWHDGWDAFAGGTYRNLLPDALFLPLDEALSQYRSWSEALGTDGWHPLWFPAFGDRSGELVLLRRRPGRPAGQLFSFHSDLDLETSYDSVTALFATALEGWQARVLPLAETLPPKLRELAARHNPLSRTPAGLSRRTISRFSTGSPPTCGRSAGRRRQSPTSRRA